MAHAPKPIAYFTHGTTLAYRRFGHGPVPMIALHGFGRTGEDFHVLEEGLGRQFTIHAFDLHFHGQSPGYPERANRPFAPQELSGLFAAYLDSLEAPKAALLGYSLGGRIALGLLEQMPERFAQAFLVAPDGLKPRPWYRGLAASRSGRWAYLRFVRHPQGVHAAIDALRAVRLMGERMHRFLKGQTDSRAKRQLVHDVWLSYRLIEPDLERVARNLAAQSVATHLFFGRYDRIIPVRLGANLTRHATGAIGTHVLPFGHVLLTRELGEAIGRLAAEGGEKGEE